MGTNVLKTKLLYLRLGLFSIMIVYLIGVSNLANDLIANYASVVLNNMLSDEAHTVSHISSFLSREIYKHHCFDTTQMDSDYSCRMYLLSLPAGQNNLGKIILPNNIRVNDDICWENNLRHRTALALIQGTNADTQLDHGNVMYFDSFVSDCVWTRITCDLSKECADSYSKNGVFNIELSNIHSRDSFATIRDYPYISLPQGNAILAVRVRGSKGYWLTVDVRIDGKIERVCDHCELTTEWQIIEMNTNGEILEEIKFNVGMSKNHNEEIIPLIAKYQGGVVTQIDWFSIGSK